MRPRPQMLSELKGFSVSSRLAATSALAASRSFCFLCRFPSGRLFLGRLARWFAFLGGLSFWSFPGCLFLRGLCGRFLAGRFGGTAASSTALRRGSTGHGGVGVPPGRPRGFWPFFFPFPPLNFFPPVPLGHPPPGPPYLPFLVSSPEGVL